METVQWHGEFDRKSNRIECLKRVRGYEREWRLCFE